VNSVGGLSERRAYPDTSSNHFGEDEQVEGPELLRSGPRGQTFSPVRLPSVIDPLAVLRDLVVLLLAIDGTQFPAITVFERRRGRGSYPFG
jgi:hypothetical protein